MSRLTRVENLFFFKSFLVRLTGEGGRYVLISPLMLFNFDPKRSTLIKLKECSLLMEEPRSDKVGI